VDELLDLLCRRGDYPRRSGSAASHGLFGLSGAAASRIALRGGAGLPLLDLLIGKSDAGGGSLYLRKAEGGEVRSGDGGLSVYVDNEAGSWYDLRLFETGITVNSVQRLTVIPPASGAVQDPDGGETGGEGGGPAGMPVTMVISREGNGWRIDAGDRSPDPAGLEKSRVDSYIAGILAMTGDDFVPPAQDAASGGTPPGDAALILELGDGRVLALRLGPPQEGRRQARLVELREGPPGTPAAGDYGYLLASWALDRVFRAPEYFTR
jgi:hypothetical protein